MMLVGSVKGIKRIAESCVNMKGVLWAQKIRAIHLEIVTLESISDGALSSFYINW